MLDESTVEEAYEEDDTLSQEGHEAEEYAPASCSIAAIQEVFINVITADVILSCSTRHQGDQRQHLPAHVRNSQTVW